MILRKIMTELDIESEEDFIYFEQFSALMENDLDIDFDVFSELLLMPEDHNLHEMTASFFEDLIRGVPDDNTELYAAIQTLKDVLLALSHHPHPRSRAFFTDELFRLRDWYLTPELIACTSEENGRRELHTPLSALTLFREEKLSGKKYSYDFSSGMPPAPDEYTLNILSEFSEDPDLYCDESQDADFNEDCGGRSFHTNYEDDYSYDGSEFDELPLELPRDFDPYSYDPDNPDLLPEIDPYRDGFVDRYNPVIDGESSETYESYDDYENL